MTTVQSMTGFARCEGGAGALRWVWELRSVNAKSLDIRMRLPPGFERYEPAIRREFQERFSRGAIQVSLSVNRQGAAVEPHLNEDAFEAVIALCERIAGRAGAEPPRIDGLLAVRGVLEMRDVEDDEETAAACDAACIEDMRAAADDLRTARSDEGTALGEILSGHVDAIAGLAETVEEDPSRSTEAIRERLGEQVRMLVDASDTLDPARLHTEAALLAAKADLSEEIDRLKAHVAAARTLLSQGGVIGRRLDFLAQEFNRESNTICSKSNAAAVTAAGLDLKVVIDRFREQVQNLE